MKRVTGNLCRNLNVKFLLPIILLVMSSFNSFRGDSLTEQTPPAAIVYKFCNFANSGYGVSLKEGEYNLAAMQDLGVFGKDISSLKVSPGFIVVLFEEDNFKGRAFSFTADDMCLIDNGLNDWANSIIVRSVDKK